MGPQGLQQLEGMHLIFPSFSLFIERERERERKVKMRSGKKCEIEK